MDNQTRKPNLLGRLIKRFRRRATAQPAQANSIPDQGPDPVQEPGGGPPAHWLEKARPAEPPAHWLEDVQRLTREGDDLRPFEFSAEASRLTEEAPEAVVPGQPDSPAQSRPVPPVRAAVWPEEVEEWGVPPSPINRSRTGSGQPAPQSEPPSLPQLDSSAEVPLRKRSELDPSSVVQPLAFRPAPGRQPEEATSRTVQAHDSSLRDQPAPGPDRPFGEPQQSARRSRSDQDVSPRDPLYGYLPLPEYDVRMEDQPSPRDRGWHELHPPSRAETPPARSDSPESRFEIAPAASPSVALADQLSARLAVSTDSPWPPIMDDYTDFDPEEHSWERIRREWARQDRIDREQRGLPRLV